MKLWIRRNESLRNGVMILLAVLAGGVLSRLFPVGVAVAQSKPQAAKVVVAQEFRLVDDEGKTRARLSLVEGEPNLDLFDAAGKPRLELTLVKGEPNLVLVPTSLS